jgi:beta-galactosidase
MNFCPTSALYRQKVAALNQALSVRYGQHPSLALWHISNEYHGTCYCDECEAGFRLWLQKKYGSLDALNAAWWSAFWSRTYTSWDQILAPRGHGEGTSVHGLCLDWRRFGSDLWADFIAAEIAAIRAGGSTVPCATNLHPGGLQHDAWRLTAPTDVISWDAYPNYHDRAEPWSVAWNPIVYQSFIQDLCRGLRPDRPWLLMETTPSSANWMDVPKLKRPGIHRLTVLQSIAHGADGALYFQWRAGRGGEEKFHGAVLENGCAGPQSRVFADVRSATDALARLAPVAGSLARSEVAIGFDWDNWWLQAEILSHGGRGRSHYPWEQLDLYREHWENAVPCDVIDPSSPLSDLSRYRLLALPQHYLLRPGFVEKITRWVEAGGVLLTGVLSGWADASDLVFPNGMHPGWSRLVGLRREELDHLYADEKNRFVFAPGNALGLKTEHAAIAKLELNHLAGAEVLATYGDDFYAGRPALTVNAIGSGFVYYQAARSEQTLRQELLAALWRRHGIRRLLPPGSLPPGVTLQRRFSADGREFWFFLNFSRQLQHVPLHGHSGLDLLTGRPSGDSLNLPVYGAAVLELSLS